MRIAIVSSVYTEYVDYFIMNNPGILNMNYQEARKAFYYDGFGWADFWSQALQPLGYEVLQITTNAEFLQKTWATEHGHQFDNANWEHSITLRQLRDFQPEVLWFEHCDVLLLSKIKSSILSIRLLMGWAGSAIPDTGMWKKMDLVLSCAPETVQFFNEGGIPSRHLNHAFEPALLDRLKEAPKQDGIIFIGNIIRSPNFHSERESMLKKLAEHIEIRIYSFKPQYRMREKILTFAKQGAYLFFGLLRRMGIPLPSLKSSPFLERIASWREMPSRPFDSQLEPYMLAPIFGLAMYQTLHDSTLALNIHANSSPVFASNMRLFESIGAGTCLVTDWKSNLSELFKLEEELVPFKCPEECIEKIKWLQGHPKERNEIAVRGQTRILKEHTFKHRAVELNNIIQSFL